MVKKRVHRYTEEFRRQAVSLADQPGKQLAKLPNPSALSKKQFQIHEGVDYVKDESVELKQLKHENASLKKENEFLKKQRRTLPIKTSKVRLYQRLQRLLCP